MEELEEGGYIKFNVTNIIKEYIKYRNIICISLAKNFTPYSKNFSAELEKSFECSGKKFPPLYIIDNNKSKSISRYEEASFENGKLAAAIENAAANNQDLQQDSSIANTDVGNEELNNNEEGLVSKVVNTAKTWWGMKKAEDPLTEEDAELLRLRSGREFNLSFINKLLLKLAKCQPNNRFSTKERLLNYLAKALASEMRDPNLANNESFSFEYDYKTQIIEKYLKEIEYSTDTHRHN